MYQNIQFFIWSKTDSPDNLNIFAQVHKNTHIQFLFALRSQ